MQASQEQPLVFLRWALIASLAYMILLREGGTDPNATELCYLALLLASNIVIPRIPYRNPRAFGSALLAVDTILVLAGLMLVGGSSQDLLIGYFLCIIMATFGDSERRIAGAAFLVTGVYAFWIFRSWEAIDRPSILIRLPFLFVTTVFYGYMMQRVRGEHALRRSAEARMRGLDCLLQVTRSFSSSLVTREVLERVADTIRTTLGVDRCHIRLVSDQCSGPVPPEIVEALERRQPVCSQNGRPGGRSLSILALPIIYEVEPLGVLLMEAERSGAAFGPEEIEFCQVVANAAASALKNARQYEDLAEIERAKSEFLSNLSHELRTPLSAILGYAELVTDETEKEPESKLGEFVGHIARSAAEMTSHVDSLLHLSQITLGRERRHLGRVDLAALLDRSLHNAQRVSLHRDIEFRLDLDPSLGEIYADGDKLQRIVQHILLNAVKFTEKGTIQLSAALVRSEARVTLPRSLEPWERLLSLSIRDTGIGVDAADLERIFREFEQADGSVTRRYPGLGIGLSVCRRLAEILGGTIRVESRPGEGSVFEVLLPVQLEPARGGAA
ncbi:MAG: GAF domain-containing sensor histidine kinase [Candidatus Binatia bacterium]